MPFCLLIVRVCSTAAATIPAKPRKDGIHHIKTGHLHIQPFVDVNFTLLRQEKAMCTAWPYYFKGRGSRPRTLARAVLGVAAAAKHEPFLGHRIHV